MAILVGHDMANTMKELIAMDGRKTCFTPLVLGSTHSHKVSVSTIRMTIKRFLETGYSQHSGGRLLLGFIIAYCEENAISYNLTACFSKEGKRVGYAIKRNKNL